MWSSPASLTAWHVYLPASSFCTRAICSTCPPGRIETIIYDQPNMTLTLLIMTNPNTGRRGSLSPGSIITPLPEVSFCPSLYQLSLGGGMALLSQDRLIWWLRTTSTFSTISSLSSPSCPRPQDASLLFTRWKIGGTSVTGACFVRAIFHFFSHQRTF